MTIYHDSMFHGEPKRENTAPGTRIVHQPVLDGRMRNRHSSNLEHRQRLHSDNEVSQLETSHNFLLPLSKRDFYTRKDTARKNLLGYLYTRQPVLHRSYSFIAGEKPINEPGLPKIASFSREKTNLDVSKSKTRSNEMTQHEMNVRQAKAGKVREFLKSGSTRSVTSVRKDDASPQRSRTNSNKMTLPDINEDLNNNEKYVDDAYSDNESWDKPRGGDKLLSFVPSRFVGHEFKVFSSKHRPITPNLLKKLDKLKLPNRTRTQEWVKMLPSDTRAHIGESRINAQYVPEDLNE
ncbi:uncharacterized protein LOC125658359 [Ostrea edulis]|uniref:uncharacterized protein LOC125658359 n=1 Tax=Ostrea edulis TaxID=37623 RepID=UPI002094A191|nr:uncharacterized protein LOC125658359 [Ostrea edulis]XP_056004411.1 uncharacterized protein LOC125658359 [Ostrea edulis]XP_056004412.1 uncharacterized protein LOC125658359 [Ostrea edulis]